MKVLKFGGTSVGSVKSILSLKKIVEREAKHQPVIVVVSALGGITDKLLSTAQLALKHDNRWREEYSVMVDRHHTLIDTIITDTQKPRRFIQYRRYTLRATEEHLFWSLSYS
jgi:aspartokinase/homoserine dehydrogenase 1